VTVRFPGTGVPRTPTGRLGHVISGVFQQVWPPATPAVTSYLPFDTERTAARGREVMPHYFTAYPLRLSTTAPANADSPGYYYQNYLAPGQVEGGIDHRRYGGLVRDYPIQTGLTSTSTSGWEQKDMEREIRDAAAAGCTGFTLDFLSIRGYDGATDTVGHWTRVKRMIAAADAVNAADGTTFRIMLMPDGTSGATAWVTNAGVPDINASADALANAISQIAAGTSVYKIDGRLVIGPYAPEKWPANTTGRTVADRVTFWTRLKATLLNTYGIDSIYWFCYVDAWTSTAPTFDALAYGHGRWGDRDVVSVSSNSVNNRGASMYCHTAFGKPWMHFGGTPMDTRPREAATSGTSYRTYESQGTVTLEQSWLAAIDGYNVGDMNQIPTWNDYSEHAHIGPTRNHGRAMLDLQAYYISRYRTGRWPTINRDCLYLSHRTHRTDATVSSSSLQKAFSAQAADTPIANIVDVVVFATTAGTVEILRDGTVIATQSVAAGRSHVTTDLPASGILSARMKRSGVVVDGTTVVSQQAIQSTILFDDYHYRCYSSLRQVGTTSATNGFGAAYGASYGA
jgi:hypothetical protein